MSLNLIVATAAGFGFAAGAVFTEMLVRKYERRRAMAYTKEIIEIYKKTHERDREANLHKVWLN